MNEITRLLNVDPMLLQALREDIPGEDVSTNSVMPHACPGTVDLIAKQNGIVAGLEVFARVFTLLDPATKVKFFCKDGDAVQNGQKLAVVNGDIRVLLSGERVALNYLQRMSGIATYTHEVAARLQGTGITLLDTRKTSPNNRVFEKYAVRVGGGSNHRTGLSDGVMLKDNHIGAAGGVAQAVKMAKAYAPFVRKIEVEVETLDQVREAVEAGADVIDTAISPFSGGTSQPATETLNYSLRELGYDTGLDEAVLYQMADYFKPIRAEYLADGTLNPISMATDTQCLNYQIPGGMLSNLLSQLKMMNALDKFDEALLETPRVRKDMGYPPLVTPTSQLVGTQAVQNVLAGERYKNVGAEMKAYCRGEYGKTPAPIDPEVKAKILGDEQPIQGRYAATLPADTFEKAQAQLGADACCEEDVLSYIAFPQVAETFFEKRREAEEKKVRYSIQEL